MRRSLALALVAGLCACRSSAPTTEDAGGAAAGDVFVLPREVVEAERAARERRGDRAEDVLLAAGGLSPSAPERSWLLIDLWLSRCATARARAETRALPE